MRKFLHILVAAFVLLLLGTKPLRAQYGDVQVTILNTADDNKPFSDCIIYMFLTEAEGRKALSLAKEALKAGGAFDPYQVSSEVTMRELYKDIPSWPVVLKDVSSVGSLLIMSTVSNNIELVHVKGRYEITVKIKVENTEMLQESIKKADRGPRVPIIPPIERGDTTDVNTWYLLPGERMGKPDARFAAQCYIVPSGNPNDTLEFRKVYVQDGTDYHATQLRRMGYDGSRDPLFDIAQKSPVLTDSTTRMLLSDKIVKNKKNRGALVKASIWLEDYNHVYFTDTLEVADLGRLARPMQFLEYSLSSLQLDPDDPMYRKEMRKVPMDKEMDLSVEFEQGKSTISPNDTSSQKQLAELRSLIYTITHTTGSELKGYRIYGVASPEGSYAKNVSLARERMQYIKREVDAQIPSSARIHFLSEPTVDADVATWSQFADSLEVDPAYSEYAKEIRSIVESYSNPDQQGPKIRQLPYYNSVIKENLGRLRKVAFKYSQSVFRAMTVEEMLDSLHNSPTFKKGGNMEAFTGYEFWMMLKHVKDTNDLEQIAKRGNELSRREASRPEYRWPLPANALASVYLAKNKVDTSILAPFIFEEEQRVNRPFGPVLLNPIPIVANQVAMMLRGEYYTRAMELAMLFKDVEDPELEKLYAITRCKAGYYDSSTPEGERYAELIRGTSVRNAIVMDMARGYMSEIPEMLDSLDQQDPVSHYLRAQYYCINHFQEQESISFRSMSEEDQAAAIRALVKCFQLDSKYIDTAASDWYIFKELHISALKEYKEPGSVLPPETDPETGISLEEKIANMTEEEKRDLINRVYAGEAVSDEEWAIYERL